MRFLFAALITVVLPIVLQAQPNPYTPQPERDKLEYIVQLESGDSFRGNVVMSGDSTLTIMTEFGRVTVPMRLIKEFIPVEGPYKRRPQHFLMPSASPNGPGFFVSNYELGFLYAGFGLGYGATVTAGATLVPTVSLKSQLYHVNVKFTLERSKEMEIAVGGTYTWFTTKFPYAHIYGVGTFPLGSGRYSAMVFYKASGEDEAPLEVIGPGTDTTRFTLYYQGSLGAGFGFDTPAFGRDDMFWVGEIVNNDITKPENTVSMIGIRVTNEHLSADFGLALFTAPMIAPVTSFTYRW